MAPPFTAAQFFDVFRRYNEAVWPAQIALNAAGLLAVVAAVRARARRSRAWTRTAIVILSILWLWTGIVYHKAFLVTLTPAGEIFGSLCIAAAALLLIWAWQDGEFFRDASGSSAVAAAVLLAYALVLYPAVGIALGHRYPAAPSFGTPCPTAIFTFGIFCLLPAGVPRYAMAIPLLWALVGSSAAIGFGMWEDAGLLIAAAVAVVVVFRETHRLLLVRPV